MSAKYEMSEVWDPRFVNNLLMALLGAIEVKDSYIQGHGKRVTEVCLAIGAKMNFSAVELRDLYVGAVLHDVGKIVGTDEEMLNKPERLDQREEIIMREHPLKGSLLVVGIDNMAHILPTILHHHERWDGKGYPGKLKGEQIPLHARIVAIADAYEAMVAPRAYRGALTQEEAIAELIKEKGGHFDPDVVEILIALLAESPHEFKDFSYYF
jgi:HD-GYP domain-containing protein (c-di-GMP phosphodiesterase class II)